MTVRGVSRRRVLYARWEIRVFRGIERFSDYKEIQASIRPATNNAADADALRDEKRGWRLMQSDKGLTTIIAVGTIVLVLLTAATLIVLLLLLPYTDQRTLRTG